MATEQAETNMEHLDYGNRGLPIETVRSADGTTIAYEKSGSGPPVVIVGGGLNEKAMHAELAEGLSQHFTVLNYDRRARGDSDDRLDGPYTVEREIEDLAAVIEAANEPCFVFANCTGGMVAVPAAASGVPMAKLAMYEPPYGAPPVPDGYMDQLAELLRERRHTEAVAHFLKYAQFIDAEIEHLQDHPIWPAFEAMAPSMLYDAILCATGTRIPTEQLAQIRVPSLVLGGKESPDWMLNNCGAVAGGIPEGHFVTMESAGHLMDDIEGAKLLARFFHGE
jgi:acyltransferase